MKHATPGARSRAPGHHFPLWGRWRLGQAHVPFVGTHPAQRRFEEALRLQAGCL